MTPELHALMKAWLVSEHEHERRHAAHRLSMPDALEFERTGRDTTANYPSAVAMVTGAMRTALDFAASGFALADDAELERRLAICRGCGWFDPAQERCRACGCFMNGKARIAAAHCPIDKW